MTNQTDVWYTFIKDKQKSWLLFENGTCVVLVDPAEDLEKQAKDLLAEYGPVHPGSPAADFSVIDLKDFPGWIVTGHHPHILNYVSPDEIKSNASPIDFVAGITGRQHRDADARGLKVVYVNDQTSSS